MDNYESYKGSMILRDHLALDRTILANERTLLAYIRTFIGLLSAGVGMIKLLDYVWTTATGYIFVIISPFILIFGIVRYARVGKKLKSIATPPSETK